MGRDELGDRFFQPGDADLTGSHQFEQTTAGDPIDERLELVAQSGALGQQLGPGAHPLHEAGPGRIRWQGGPGRQSRGEIRQHGGIDFIGLAKRPEALAKSRTWRGLTRLTEMAWVCRVPRS